MIVSNIRLDIPNGRVVKLAQAVKGKDWMTRKEIREWIEEMVNETIDGEREEAHPRADTPAEEPACEEAQAIRNRSVRGFVPSRGDEEYLYKPKDPELAAACSTVLDGLEYVERYVWDALERNRATS